MIFGLASAAQSMRMSDDDMGNDVSGLVSESYVSTLLRKRLSQREQRGQKECLRERDG